MSYNKENVQINFSDIFKYHIRPQELENDIYKEQLCVCVRVNFILFSTNNSKTVNFTRIWKENLMSELGEKKINFVFFLWLKNKRQNSITHNLTEFFFHIRKMRIVQSLLKNNIFHRHFNLFAFYQKIL